MTVGLSTYSSDDRFLVEHTRHLGNWALRIRNAQKEDEGIYECQLSTHPPESIFIELRIVGELLIHNFLKYILKQQLFLKFTILFLEGKEDVKLLLKILFKIDSLKQFCINVK